MNTPPEPTRTQQASTARDGGGFTEGSVTKHIISLSGVMILGFLAMTLGSMVEVFYLGMVGKEVLAAITFSFPITMGLNAMTRGIGVGAATLIARSMGQGNREEAALITTHGYLLIIVFTLALSLAGQFYADAVFQVLGAKGEVLQLTTGYAHIWLFGFPMMAIAMVSNGLIRSFGDVAIPGYIMASGPLIQVVLGPFLIFGLMGFPALGLKGAAWTSVIGALSQFLISGYWYLVRERLLRLTLHSLLASAKSILHVGIPAAATNLIQPLAAAVITWLLAGFSVSVVAGFGVATRIEAVVSMVVIGISTSIVPIVGQNWGAGKLDRVKEALRTCYLASLAWGAIAAIIMWIGAPYFIHVINEDPALVETATLYLYIAPIGIGFLGMITVSTNAFNALQRPGPALILSLTRLLVIYVPMAWLASSLLGYVGVFLATSLTNIIVGILGALWYRSVMEREWRARG